MGDDYYQQEEAAQNDHAVEKLQKKVRYLEEETSNLRMETSSLKEFICEVEAQSQEKIDQYLKQLETANVKVSFFNRNLKCIFEEWPFGDVKRFPWILNS